MNNCPNMVIQNQPGQSLYTELTKLVVSREASLPPHFQSFPVCQLWIHRSLNRQNQLCHNPRPNSYTRTFHIVPGSLFFCSKRCSCTPACEPSSCRFRKTFKLCIILGVHGGPVQPSAAPAPNSNALAGWIWIANANPSSSVPPSVVAASLFPMQPYHVDVLKHPRAPSASLGLMDYQNADHGNS